MIYTLYHKIDAERQVLLHEVPNKYFALKQQLLVDILNIAIISPVTNIHVRIVKGFTIAGYVRVCKRKNLLTTAKNCLMFYCLTTKVDVK